MGRRFEPDRAYVKKYSDDAGIATENMYTDVPHKMWRCRYCTLTVYFKVTLQEDRLNSLDWVLNEHMQRHYMAMEME